MAPAADVAVALEEAEGAEVPELAELVVLVVAGALTANWLPVTTVTSAPFVTWLGS